MRKKFMIVFLAVFGFIPTLIFGQTVTQIAAGTDQISAALAAASAGDIIELVTDGGIYNETATTLITVPVTIRAKRGLSAPPVWTCDNGSRAITLSADLTLYGSVFDGS